MVFKNIKIKKKGGGTRLQRVEVLPSGKYKFVKNNSKSLTNLTKKPKRKPKTMAKKRKRGKRKFTLPLAPIAGLAVGLANPIQLAVDGRWDLALTDLAFRYTGYNANTKSFDIGGLTTGLVPLVIGGLVHKFVGGAPLNLNQMLGKAGVPIIRI